MFKNMINVNDCPGHVLNEKTVIEKSFIFETRYCIICTYVEGTSWVNNER